MSAIAQRYGNRPRGSVNEWSVRERQPARGSPIAVRAVAATLSGAHPLRRLPAERPAVARERDCGERPAGDFYVARRGDSLETISWRVGVPPANLKTNALRNRTSCTRGSVCELRRSCRVTQAEADGKSQPSTPRAVKHREGAAVQVVARKRRAPSALRTDPRTGRGGGRSWRPRLRRGCHCGGRRRRAHASRFGSTGRRAEPGARPGIGDAGPGRPIDYQSDDGSIRVEATETSVNTPTGCRFLPRSCAT